MTRIAAVHPVLPPNVYDQAEITERFAAYCLGEPDGRVHRAAEHALVRRLHTSASVSRRHLALPIDRYPELDGFGAANDAFIEVATELGGQAILGALDEAGLRPDQVDYVVSTTVTGAAVPSIEARIATEIGLRPDVRRVPLFGLGCVAGASGLARLHDLLRGDPKAVGVLVSVELCSLTVQRDDPSTANLVASGLFGDGAAAVVAVGDEHPGWGPTIVDSRAHLYPDTQRAMGWDIGASGLKIVLGAEVPDLVTEFLGEDVRQFLKPHDLDVGDVTAWVAHPGGPKVLDAMQEALDLTDGELDLTWRSLDRIGNLSSSSVLHVLRDTLDQRDPAPGSPGLLLAMGPGFCSELVLLRW
jgi:alkylresorcinol/alkylpyrone synthase